MQTQRKHTRSKTSRPARRSPLQHRLTTASRRTCKTKRRIRRKQLLKRQQLQRTQQQRQQLRGRRRSRMILARAGCQLQLKVAVLDSMRKSRIKRPHLASLLYGLVLRQPNSAEPRSPSRRASMESGHHLPPTSRVLTPRLQSSGTKGRST